MIDDRHILSSLGSLTPISLQEINGANLMDRVEIKYLFSFSRLSDLINLMKDKYIVLEIKNTRALPYCTTYLDTKEYLFFNQHNRGELSRYKIRYRQYEINGDSFLEIKMKNNKRRTYKWRVENLFQPGVWDEKAELLINSHLGLTASKLFPVLINRFNRITVVGKETDERITLDYNISFTDPLTGSYTEMPYLAVIELKKPEFSQFSYFNSLIKQMNIHPEGFSKYCTGNAILKNFLKTNMIKPKLLLLNKIENEYTSSSGNRSK